LFTVGCHRELEQALNIYRSNLATDYHNRFASEWNKKNYAEAERILNEGLVEFPKDRQLLSDKQIIVRQNRQRILQYSLSSLRQACEVLKVQSLAVVKNNLA
jgi:hypothetical protein